MSARVVITGAASGIGAATVERLRKRGAEVVGLDLTVSEPGIIACDVADQASVDSAVAEAIDRLGGLDVLINCAGIGPVQRAGDRPGPDAAKVMDVNLLGPWRVTAAALPALRESRGRVVNVASGLAYVTMPFAPAYCMSKRGLVAYSDALRIEHGDEITVTTVYPGYIKTPIHEQSAVHGISLEGLVPSERVSDASSTLVRAALDEPARDLATTRSAAVGYGAMRLLPRAVIDRMTRQRLKRAALRGDFDDSALAADLRAGLLRP